MDTNYTSVLKNLRITPRKVRLVADLVRGKTVQNAIDTLKLTNKRSAPVLSKMIKSAIANATNSATVDIDRLTVSEIYVDCGPVMKRFMPRAQGRATPIKKRTSHITLKLREI